MTPIGAVRAATIVAVGIERLLSLPVDPAVVSAVFHPAQAPSGQTEQVTQVQSTPGADVFGGVRRAPLLQLSPDARQFNAGPTRARLIHLAEQSPAEARGIFSSMLRGLDAAAAPQALRSQLSELIAADDAQLPGKVRDSTLVRTIFPDSARDFDSTMAALATTRLPGWQTSEVPQVAVTGVLRSIGLPGQVVLDAGDRYFELVSSPRLRSISPPVQAGWLEGFMHDGEDLPLTVQGTVSADGKQFLVEGFMPGSSDAFVFGRVQVVLPNGEPLAPYGNPPSKEVREEVLRNGKVQILTARGVVEVVQPTLRAQLVHLPRLGVILPVAVNEVNGQHVIDQPVTDYFALGGRFQSSPSVPAQDLGNGTYASRGRAAYDNFDGTFFISGGLGVGYRMENNNGDRNLPFGHFEADATGELTAFRGSYVSADLGLGRDLPYPSGPEGNAAQSVVAGAEAAVRQPNDHLRAVPPPP